jgi:hypothetical protein
MVGKMFITKRKVFYREAYQKYQLLVSRNNNKMVKIHALWNNTSMLKIIYTKNNSIKNEI